MTKPIAPQSRLTDRQLPDPALKLRDAQSVPEALPAESPLAMHAQDLDAPPVQKRASQTKHVYLWRVGMLVAPTLMTSVFAYKGYQVLSLGSLTALQLVFLLLSTAAFSWVAWGTCNTVSGFMMLAGNRHGDTIALPAANNCPASKTALLFPIFKEEPARIAATIQAIAEELERLGASRQFDTFILSDTRSAKTGEYEKAVFENLREILDRKMKVYYRRRNNFSGKKPGNIADWVRQYGGAYEHFIIFDADSIMTGEAIVRLALAMEQEPGAGLIQTIPKLTGGKTLFARLHEFATAVYGPMVSTGLAAWHGSQGNYWGHNAIIRTQAFAGAAGLPVLSGRRPLGGHIQSHDFVEAALLHRAGWGVHIVPSLEGSYEECPPNAVDFIARDRRWCQGNLQHLRLVARRGLTGMSRVHLSMGIASYVVSPVWAATLVLGLVLALQADNALPAYFGDEKTLFPVWPMIDAGAALRLFIATMVVVLLPKFLGLILQLKQLMQLRPGRRLSGIAKAACGVLVETVYAVLFAPLLMVTQTMAVAGVFLGRDSGWHVRRRGGENMAFREFMRLHVLHSLIGLAVAAISFRLSYALMGWMAPVFLGLCLAGPLSWSTSKPIPEWLNLCLCPWSVRKRPAIIERIEELQARDSVGLR